MSALRYSRTFSHNAHSMFTHYPTIKAVKELPCGSDFQTVAIIRKCDVTTSSRGSDFLKVEFADNSSSFTTPIWDNLRFYQELKSGVISGAVLITGKTDFYQGGFSPKITNVVCIPQNQIADLLPRLIAVSKRPADEMRLELEKTLLTIENAQLRDAVKACLDWAGWNRFCSAPAGRSHHHACLGGLLEHTLSMVRAADLLLPHYSLTVPLKRDVIIATILIHDVAKVFEYACEDYSWKFTPYGSLIGHITGGYDIWMQNARKCNVAEDIMAGVGHAILAHHGQTDWGSPVSPTTCNGWFVHLIDLIDSRMGSMARLHDEGAMQPHQQL